jgi:molybdate transport system ATP-binding protein
MPSSLTGASIEVKGATGKSRAGLRSGLTIRLSQVSLDRGERRVLRNINWRIAPGERWVLLGANGAGKTQLLKLLAGDIWPAPDRNSRRIYRWRSEVFDEPYGVKQEIAYLGAERQDRYEHYEWNQRVTSVVGTGLYRSDIPLNPLSAADKGVIARLLARTDLSELAARRFLTLSYGQRRLVLLARALAWRPALLLMDEALNGLDAEHRQQALGIIQQISHGSTPWVLATHRVEDIPAAATHLLSLVNGRVAWRGRLTAAKRRSLQVMPVSVRRAVSRRSAARPGRGDEPLITLRNATVWLDKRAVLKRLQFDIHAGDCWMVHGPNGSGKSTLVRALYGDLGVAAQGSLRRRGIESGVPISEFKRRVGLVAPELQALHPLYLKAIEVVVSGLHSSVGLDARPTASERRRALAALQTVQAARLADRELRALSYGQLRRVLFARALVHEPDILLLDEPYTGLDAPTRRALQARIERSAASGKTILMTTHHRDEWPRAATHELQLRGGLAVYCGPVRFP